MAVLIVEDVRPVALRYVAGFARRRIEAVHAEDVKSAKQCVEEQHIEAALVDMGIAIDNHSTVEAETKENPRNGLELLNWLGARQIPTFALTGSLDEKIRRLIDCPLIEKPIEDFDADVVDLVTPYLQSAASDT
jgi:DNA-binding response OmpR family regulator